MKTIEGVQYEEITLLVREDANMSADLKRDFTESVVVCAKEHGEHPTVGVIVYLRPPFPVDGQKRAAITLIESLDTMFEAVFEDVVRVFNYTHRDLQ